MQKVQNLENEKQMTRDMQKVCAIFYMRAIRKSVIPEFIKLCKETPCWCPFEVHKYGHWKPTETSVVEFSFKYVDSSLEDLIRKIKVIFILRQGIFR